MSGTDTRLLLTTLGALAILCVPAPWIACLSPDAAEAFAQDAAPAPDEAAAAAANDAADRRAGDATAGQPDAAGRTPSDADAKLQEAEKMAEMALAAEAPSEEDEAVLPAPTEPEKINLLQLLLKGRWLMLPIGLMSLLVVAVGADRFLGLRRGRVLPTKLVDGLGELANEPEGFDPRKAYRLCGRYRSAASKVVQAMLLKVGRPHSELEHAINQASQREADRLHSNVRWLNLAAAVTPLLGLLGTVWGMIEAFFRTARLPVEQFNRAQDLADGIWMALVTTFAGLTVAIPAAILAHYFEGRIQKLFRELDETLFGLLPHLERFEGRLRLTKDQLERPDSRPLTTAAQARKPRKPTASPK